MESVGKIPCTVNVLTFNSEKGLRRCLESVKDFAEIIICDGGSTDATLRIAAEYSAVILNQDPAFKTSDNKIADFSGVRNQTLDASTQPWFLVLDSDEYLSAESVREIDTLTKNDSEQTPKIFHVLRKYEVAGKIIDCAGTYPSYQPRFFHRDHVTSFARKLHEKIVPKMGEQYGYLTKAMVVPLEIDMPTIRKKHAYYLAIEEARSSSLSRVQLLKAMFFSLRSIGARWIKVFLNIFRPGTKMPLAFEWISTLYSLQLSIILLKLFLKKWFV
jgi:glycosyltransferase involved in cell wall biosynthesis